LLLCFLLLPSYWSTLEPSLKALSLKALSLKALSLKALSPTLALRLRLNTHTKSMGDTIRAPRVSDLTAAMRALAARMLALVVRCRQT
jgi:hypothetical protein